MNTIDGDLHVRGRLTAGTLAVPSAGVGNAQVGTSDPITADKIQLSVNLVNGTNHGTAVTAVRKVIYQAKADGVIQVFRAGLVVAATGDYTVTVDLYKNGTSIITAIVLDATNLAFTEETAAGLTAAYVADDVFEMVVTVAGTTGAQGQGLYVNFQAYEDPA